MDLVVGEIMIYFKGVYSMCDQKDA